MSRTIVVKKHEYPANSGPDQNAILLLRNPFDAYKAEFNRLFAGHVGHANDKLFASSSKFARFKFLISSNETAVQPGFW